MPVCSMDFGSLSQREIVFIKEAHGEGWLTEYFGANARNCPLVVDSKTDVFNWRDLMYLSGSGSFDVFVCTLYQVGQLIYASDENSAFVGSDSWMELPTGRGMHPGYAVSAKREAGFGRDEVLTAAQEAKIAFDQEPQYPLYLYQMTAVRILSARLRASDELGSQYNHMVKGKKRDV